MKLLRVALLLSLGVALSDAYKLRASAHRGDCIPSSRCMACTNSCDEEYLDCSDEPVDSVPIEEEMTCRKRVLECARKCLDKPSNFCCDASDYNVTSTLP